MKEVDKDLMYDELVRAFIEYQWRLDNPYPAISETKEVMLDKFINDSIFHNKVRSLASGVMQIVSKHI